MEKKVIFALAALLTASNLNAQDTYFTTSFEDGIPSSFTLHDVDQRTPSNDMQKIGFAVGTPWIDILEPDGNGNHIACSTSWYKNAGKSNDWMVTEGIDIKSEKAVLRWRSRASDKDYRDGMAVYVSEKGTNVDDFDTSAPVYQAKKENYTWIEHTVDLSAYKGKKVYIAFVNNSTDANCLYVDDIFVGVPSKVNMSLDLARVSKTYGDILVSGNAFATDKQTHKGFIVGYRVNGKTVEQTFDQTITADGKTAFTLDTPLHIERNQTIDYDAWIKCDGDSTGISSKVSAYPLKLVSEEVTGTWCGYCIRGIVGMKTMNDKYPDTFIGIAIHNDSNTKWPDAMAAGVEDYHDYIYNSCGITGYPHCVFSRNPNYSIDPQYMEKCYTAIMSEADNYTGIELKAQYNKNTGKIDTNTDIYFAKKQSNTNYKLAYVIVENNVHRTHAELGLAENEPSGYDQNNYYGNNAQGVEMGGYEKMGSTVRAEQIWYNDVARSIYPTPQGEEGIIPADIAEGDHFSDEVSLDIPTNVLNSANTEIIVLLLEKNGIIVNADKVKIEGIETGIEEVANNNTIDTNAYYNLQGMRVAKGTKGLLIHSGKKCINK
ncbi:choice-of-anchor J domain-containing protein [Prevotella merdae]|uniref:choice-of-anchor J domain-containing protein n=1 Tax=Prevotella merdae TaxID=2079531 RepID=UPI003F7F2ED2